MGRDLRGDGRATVKSPAYAYPGSNPGPATPHLTCGNAVAPRFGHAPELGGFTSDFPPPDAVPTPTVPPAPLGRTRPRSAWPPRVRPAGIGGCRRDGRACRR